MSLIVYTAITAGYDVLSDPPEETRVGAKFIAFTETPSASPCWEIRPLEQNLSDPKRRSAFYKMLSHRVFPDAQFSLWIDGSVDLIMPFSVTNLLDYLRDADLAIFEHSSRCCIYQEAVECIRRRRDDPHTIYKQVQRYTQ
ncbi:MAG TPA: glycosyltransferase domain-containing protein, partial [Phycisphaerae bacterium]|nr:glycosyltransferase domain-containing protein [Phycisphaerae bacterium]